MLPRCLFLLLFLPCWMAAQLASAPQNYVTDEAHVLSDAQQRSLNLRLSAFEAASGNQIFVYLAPSLGGNDIVSLSQDIFHQWKIGSESHDNGVLIAVFVKDHAFRIHTGYGLEGQLPDLLTKKIQDESMRPYFRQQDFYTGIDKGITELMYYTAHAYKPEPKRAAGTIINWVVGYAINALLLALYAFLLFRKSQTRKHTALARGIFLSIAVILTFIPCVGAICLFGMLFFVIDFKKNGKGFSSSGSSYQGYSSGDSSNYSSYNPGSDFSGGDGGNSDYLGYSGHTSYGAYDAGSDLSSGSGGDSSSYSSFDSGSDFSGGGGGDSGGGGSSSDW